MTPISPWPRKTECPHPDFAAFKQSLMNASFHHAGSVDEWGIAKSDIKTAAEIAISADWPYWAMERMFSEIAPLVFRAQAPSSLELGMNASRSILFIFCPN